MQQATRNVQPAQSKPEPPMASIRLVRGASTQAAKWLLRAGPGGTALSIGAGPSCEWQIRAAGVPPRALCLMLTELGLYARSECEGSVRLNGHRLGKGWEVVPRETRVDIGMASLALSLSEDSALAPRDDALLSDLDDSLGARERPRISVDPEPSGRYPTDPSESARQGSLLPWRFSQSSLPDAPSVLGRYARPANKLWLYLVTGVALGGYAFWIALLD